MRKVEKKRFRKVMVFGTFDVFHKGHRYFLEEAKKYGDYLLAVVARDKTVLFLKKYKTENNEEERLKIIRESGIADKVVLGKKLKENDRGKQFELIKEFKPDIICLGYDQKFFVDKLRDNIRELGFKDVRIVRLKSYKPEIYKSSKLRK